MQEIWKVIPNTQGLYSVSNTGKIFSKRLGQNLKLQTRTKYGHKMFVISINGITKRQQVHRVVAKAFLPNPNNYPCINHKDCNPSNNEVANIEWCTFQYNNQYTAKMKRYNPLKGEDSPCAKLTTQQVKEIKSFTDNIRKTKNKWQRRGYIPKLAQKYNIKEGSIKAIVNGYNWKHI